MVKAPRYLRFILSVPIRSGMQHGLTSSLPPPPKVVAIPHSASSVYMIKSQVSECIAISVL